MSSLWIHLITYAAVLTFGAAVAYRFFRIYSMPMHLRWELYPVAHEPGKKASYGGSMLEEVGWWKKPRETSFIGTLKVMVPEMTLLVALFEHNRKMWYRSFPFHFGLYILAGMIGLLVLGAIMELFEVYVGPGASLGSIVYYLTQAAALFGLGLSTVGAAGLLHLRLFDPEQRDYTSPAMIFNLLFFLAAFAVAWLCFIFADNGFAATRSFIQSLLTFDLTAPLGGGQLSWSSHLALSVEIVLAMLLLAYIPLTHMAHFFIKWFTWDKVRWDDEPNMKGSEIEQRIGTYVQYPVTWSAAHLAADGKKNWLDIAVEGVKGDKDK
jgi:nitrate reductase gamma subunit